MINHPNRSNLYTVTNRHGDVQERGCTVAEAAQIVMNYDGHDFEIRPENDGEGFALWVTQFSRNSTLGGKPMTKSVHWTLTADRAQAEAEIYAKVIKTADMWSGCDVQSDADYDAMIAGLE